MRSFSIYLRRAKPKAVGLLAIALMCAVMCALCCSATTVSAETVQGHAVTEKAANETADSVFYGLTVLEWAVIVLAFILLIGFFWIRNMYLFFGFIALVAIEMIVHFFG